MKKLCMWCGGGIPHNMIKKGSIYCSDSCFSFAHESIPKPKPFLPESLPRLSSRSASIKLPNPKPIKQKVAKPLKDPAIYVIYDPHESVWPPNELPWKGYIGQTVDVASRTKDYFISTLGHSSKTRDLISREMVVRLVIERPPPGTSNEQRQWLTDRENALLTQFLPTFNSAFPCPVQDFYT